MPLLTGLEALGSCKENVISALCNILLCTGKATEAWQQSEKKKSIQITPSKPSGGIRLKVTGLEINFLEMSKCRKIFLPLSTNWMQSPRFMHLWQAVGIAEGCAWVPLGSGDGFGVCWLLSPPGHLLLALAAGHWDCATLSALFQNSCHTCQQRIPASLGCV